MQFESQIYSAVEAGVTSSSGQKVWSVPNTFVYVFREGFTSHSSHQLDVLQLSDNDRRLNLDSAICRCGLVVWDGEFFGIHQVKNKS